MWTVVLIFGIWAKLVNSQSDGTCVCVPYYQCTSNGTVITDGAGIFDERIGKSCTCNCTTNLEICCFLPSVRSSITAPSACGYRNPDGFSFKIASEGEQTAFGEFPWMVQIFENGKVRCGGSLIHPSAVLTAAHCVKNTASTYTVRAGEWNTAATDELEKHQDRTAASVKIHEEFKPRIYHNDIALLFLNEPFKLAEHVNLTCLVPDSGVTINDRCVVTGWGKENYTRGANNSQILKKVDLPLVGKSECQEALRKTRLGRFYNLHNSFICAGGEENKDACVGDGGGPLVCPIDGEDERFQQVGIVAWGIDCNMRNVPGVYADVGVLRKWIDKQMRDKQLDASQYQYK